MSDDHDLRVRFEALRQLDSEAIPDVDAILARRPVRPPRRLMLAAIVAAAAALLLLVAGLQITASRPSISVSVSPTEPSLLEWRSPTASLLETPGSELLQTPSLESSLLRSLP